jgi:uncharacterized membrane protein YkoI
MKQWIWLVAAALATTGAVATTSTALANQGTEENETPVSLDKIPKAAADALTREAGGAPITDVVQETKNGQTVYEAHVRKGTEVVGIEVDANGKVLSRHTEHKEKEHK